MRRTNHDSIRRFACGRLGRRFALAGAAGLGLISHAQAWDGLTSEFSANVSLVEAKGMLKNGPYTVQAVAGGGARVVGPATIRGPGGAILASELMVGVGRHAATAMAVRAGTALLPGVGAAIMIWDIYDHFRVKPDGSGGLLWDPGVAETSEMQYRWTASVNCSPAIGVPGNFGGPDEAFNAAFQACLGNGQAVTGSPGSCPGGGAYLVRSLTNIRALSETAWRADLQTVSTNVYGSSCGGTKPAVTTVTQNFANAGRIGPIEMQACPQVYINGLLQVPPKGIDGRCPSGDGGPREAITPEVVADKVSAATAYANSLEYDKMLREAVGLADMPFPATGPDAPAQELPSVVPEVVGPTTTTTHEDGTVTEVATGWNFARDPLRKNTGVWNKKETVTKKDAQGNVISTSSTTTQSPSPSASGAVSGDPSDPCAADPGRLGCIGLGEAPNDEVPKASTTVSFSSESLGLPSGCPSPISMGDVGELSFEATCNAFEMARPAVLAAAAFSALMIVLYALRGGE